MNYFFGCSNYIFTPGQKKEISRSLTSSSRDYLRSNYQPNTTKITGTTALISPENRARTTYDSKVLLKWSKSAGADFYLVELDVSPTLDYDLKTFVTNEDSILIENLLPEKNYFWRIRPFNEFHTCATPSETRRFITAKTTSVSAIPGVQEIRSYPSIVHPGTQLQLSINAEVVIKGELLIIDLQGRIVKRIPTIRFNSGSQQLPVAVDGLPSGLYILHLSAGDGIYNSKFIIP